ncbi:MAG: dihydrolipoamide acetyltransferase family protein [Hoeflea sp. D1-CHI-28]
MANLLMPKFGLTMTEGLLSEWHVGPGEAFCAGQLLYTVETEKVANEVEAEIDGTLSEILVSEGETVPVGTPVARISDLAGETEVPGASLATPAEERDVQDAPAARKLMAEHGLSRGAVDASGRDGRVMKEDVLRVIATPLAKRIGAIEGVALEEIVGSGARGRIKAADVETAAARAARPAAQSAVIAPSGATEIAASPARLSTARRVSASKRDIPHFYMTHEAELSALTELRQGLNTDSERARISVTHMLIRAVGVALAELPVLNRIWSNDRIVAFDRVDVGMVVETPEGLRIPVVRDVGGRGLDEIAKVAAAAADRARSGALAAEDVGDSAIAISNVGMFGVSSMTPIINPPNAMIIGVGADRKLFRPGADGAPPCAMS